MQLSLATPTHCNNPPRTLKARRTEVVDISDLDSGVSCSRGQWERQAIPRKGRLALDSLEVTSVVLRAGVEPATLFAALFQIMA